MFQDTVTSQGRAALQLIHDRASTRAYSSQELDRSVVQTLLEAAIRAPTALHQEPWSFVVVQDRALLKRISDAAKPLFLRQLDRISSPLPQPSAEFTDPHFNIFYDAGVLIVVCADSRLPFIEADCWLAAENIMLASAAMELGSCAIGSALSALNLISVKKELGIPDDISAIAAVIVGVPHSRPVPTSRRAPRILSWKLADLGRLLSARGKMD